MKYSDFITLQDYFHPVFNLQNEAIGYWEKFIPTNQFNTLLERMLDAVSSNLPANRKSIWVQGTFGTGKSHAGSVIKHLLCDEVSEISKYISYRIENPILRNRLTSLRNNKCYFPVVLSGVEGAYNPHTFALTLERMIKETLRNAGHKINVKSDFENAIDLVENKAPYIQELIDNTPELRIIAKTKEEMMQKLRNYDIEFYMILEDALQQQYSVQLSSGDLTKWLSEVETEIRNKGIADGLLIFWDEFTSILDTISNGAINMLQKIAELSEKQNIYLYLISHRNTKAYGERADEIKKMQDRFHIIQYNMEAITTYHIMAATLKKSDVIQNGVSLSYDMIRDKKMHKFDELITYLTNSNLQQSKDDVKNLFPLHPYTSFLCSSLADHIGSANRSVFNFMYDSKKGLLNFLQDEGAYADNRLLTANCLWDFFLDSFLGDSIKYGIVTETYHAHINNVVDQGVQYEKVFKGILLLNAMRNTFEKEQVLPSSKNIKYLFSNEDFEAELDTILEYLDKNQIIQKDPSDNFLIAFSSLPATKINEEKKRAEAHYKDALTILEFDPSQKQNLTKWFDDSLIRYSEYCFLACSADEYFIKSRLNKEFKQSYSLHIALLFAMDEEERQAMSDIVSRLAKEDFQNVLFVVFTESLNEDSLQRQRFIDYVATQTVANKHNSNDQAQTNQKNANQIVLNWLNRLRQGNCTLYFNTSEIPQTANNTAQHINQNIIFKIFSSGYENLLEFRKKRDTFYSKTSVKAAEAMLCANDRNDAEERLKKSSQITPVKFLLKDDYDNYIVEQDLKLKSCISTNHPLILVQNKVDELFKRAKQQQHAATFNLGQVLSPLTDVPFGLYSNIPNVALLAFALRKYQKELYNAEVGIPITTDNLCDIVVDLFYYWQNGKNESKLRVRFGSKEEKELIDILIAVFDLRNVPEVGELSSIKNVRWGIAYYCKHKSKYPLWCLKNTENALEGVNKLIDQIVNLVHKEDTQTEQIKQLFKSIKEYQHDLQRLLLSKDTFEKGFRNFVNGIESVTIENDWWNELSKYLSERMGEEIGWRKETDVESKVKDFYIKKITPTQKPISQPNNTIDTPAMPNSSVLTDKVNAVRNKITQASLPTPELKRVLIQVLENFPETADLINENLG